MPDPKPSPRAEAPARPARNTGSLSLENFASALTAIRDGESGGQTRLHVFSLSDFREAVGGKWGKLAGLIEVAADAIIHRNVNSDRDIFTRLDAEISCLALPNASRQETRACVAAIAGDLTRYLFGDAVIGGRRPQVVAANLPLDKALTEAGEIDRDAILAALARAGAALAAEGPAAGAVTAHGVALATLAGASLATDLSKAGSVFAISGGHGAAEPVGMPAWVAEQAAGRGKGGAPASVMTMERPPHQAATSGVPDWLEAQVDQRAQGTGARPLAPETNLTLVWTPTWVTSRQAIGAFHARIIRADLGGEPPLEGGRAYADATPVEALTLDRFVATQGARELKDMFFGRHRSGLTLPFHWMSLAPRWRDCIRIPFEDCPAQARRKLLKVEIFGLPPDIPASILQTLFDPLEKLGCDVMARLPLTGIDLIGHLRAVRAVGVDLAELADDDKVGDDELFARLDLFREAARKARLASYVWGVRRRPLIGRLVRAGFSLVNGPGVMCDLGRPMLPSAVRRVA